MGFSKPAQSLFPSNSEPRKSKSPQRQSLGSNLSYGGNNGLRQSTSSSSHNNTNKMPSLFANNNPMTSSIQKQQVAPSQKRDIPKFLQKSAQPSLLLNQPKDDSVEIEIEFDENDLHTIEISSSSSAANAVKPSAFVMDRRTDEEILGISDNQLGNAQNPQFAWSINTAARGIVNHNSSSDLSSGLPSSSNSSSVIDYMIGGNKTNNINKMQSNQTFDYHSYKPTPQPAQQNFLKQKNQQLHSLLNEQANKVSTIMKPQSQSKYAEIIDVDSDNSTGIQTNIRPQPQPYLQKASSHYSNQSQGSYKVNQLFMQRMAKEPLQFKNHQNDVVPIKDDESLFNKYRKNITATPTPQPVAPPPPPPPKLATVVQQKPTTSPITDSFYYKHSLDQQSKAISSSSFKKPAPEPKPFPTVSPDEEKRMKDKISKKLGTASSINIHSSTSSSSKGKHSSFLEQKLNDEAKKQTRQFIKNSKQGQDYAKKEEEQRIEKERAKEMERKQAEEELKIRQQKEKEDMYQQLFGVVAKKDEKKTEKQSTPKMSEDDARLFKEIQEEAQRRRAAEEKGEFDREAAIARVDFEAQKRDEKERKLRYQRRKDPNELIHRILNLEIIEMFQDKLFQQELSNVPLQFQSFEHYQTIWIPLFLYETYSQMISKRTEGEKDRELMEAQGIKINQNVLRKKHFEGFISKASSDYYYMDLRLYESAQNDPDKFGNYAMGVLDSLKEFDLLLISEQPLPVDEAKKLTGIDYLMNMKKEKGKMLSLVSARRKKDSPYIQLKVDNKIHEDYLLLNVRSNDLLKVHVYFFDSLITSVREFRTINCCEFFPTAQFILDPTQINKHRDSQPASLEPQRMAQMQLFIKQNSKSFNASQLEALDNVIKMKKEDFLLIQGPPGTGKTHTIQGIITMLVKAQVKKILICAPSNAAIDEIVMRIATLKLFGLMTDDDLKEKLLRIGSMDYEPLPAVKKFTLDAKLKDEMDGPDINALKNAKPGSNIDLENKIDTIKQRTQAITTMRRILNENKMDKEKGRFNELLRVLHPTAEAVLRFSKQSKEDMLKELKSLEDAYEKKRLEIKGQLDATSEVKRLKPKNKRSEVEKQIVQKAQIICTTLSMSAIEKLDILGNETLEYLIVDEACQCVELNCLIPFEHNPQKVILVGDQQQLPATTFSDNSDRTFYSRSLFERFLQNGVNRYMLSIQYRMHPLIRQFPSDQFYDGRLQDAECVVKQTPDKKSFLVREIEKTIQNIVFFDLKYAQEEAKETSKSNKDEAKFIEELFSDIIKIMLKSADMPREIQRATHSAKMEFVCQELRGKIGIITPYKSQVRTLKDNIYPKLRSLNFPLDLLEINTVDAYQGREKEIIIISCVRGSQERTLGFLNDYRRMNVAITRAKHFLWVVGNSRTLKRNENWDQLINFTRVKSQEFMKLQSPQKNMKSSKKQCYIQLNSKDQWMDHKLLNILMGTVPNTNQSKDCQSDEELKQPANDNKNKKSSSDKITGKRQLRDDLNEIKKNDSPEPERLRDEKYRQKFGGQPPKTPDIIPPTKSQPPPPPVQPPPQQQVVKPTGDSNLDKAFQQLFASFGTAPVKNTTPSKPSVDLAQICKDATLRK